ncbi:MAG: hypothetical protein IJT73_10695 [Selenomonadaceae bacterium]|nr:hypothetical protein [Selenomonadaceae bacterium]
MQASKLFLLVIAVMIFTVIPKYARADSVSVTASISAQISVEVNTEKKSEDKPIYTGVIIDCRGLGLQRAMSPVIKNENGEIIYGDKDLDFDKITEIGMASYANNMNETERAGDHPLILQATKLNNFNSNPVLSNADSNRLLIANEISGFLKDCKVVFLTD